MKVVVDTNIIFSAILKSSSNIGKIIINPKKNFELFSTNFLEVEVYNHTEKIIRVSGLNLIEIESVYRLLMSKVNIIPESDIPFEIYNTAKNISIDIDINDSSFVALSLYLNAKLWTGDKKLINGLHSKGLDLTITTSELIQISNDFENNIFSTN